MKIKLYHGTNKKAYEELRKHGTTKIFLTLSDEQAEYYAECASEENNDEPIVCVIEVDSHILFSDRPSFDEPLTFILDHHNLSEDDWHEAIESGEIEYPDSKDWELSLYYTQSVVAIGTIKPENILDLDSDISINEIECIQSYLVKAMSKNKKRKLKP